MEMGSLAQFLPMLMQMMQQNRPPTATPGINPTAQQPPQMVPGAFGQMPGLSSAMGQRAPVEIFNSVNPMGTGGLSQYGTGKLTYNKKGNPVYSDDSKSNFLGSLFGGMGL